MQADFDEFAKNYKGQSEIAHVLSHLGDNREMLKGYINGDIIKECASYPGEKTLLFAEQILWIRYGGIAIL